MSATVSYVPAIHEGYVKFFEKYPQDLYVIGNDLISTIPRLDRDIRALEPSRVVKALASIGVSQSVTLLSSENIQELRDIDGEIVMPNESANHTFAEQHLGDHSNIQFIDAFLRWDMLASFSKIPVDDEAVQLTESMGYLLELARAEASKSPDWWRQIGAVALTESGEVLATHNTHLPSPDYSLNTFGDPRANFDVGQHIEVSKAVHAEARLISHAAKIGQKLENSTLLVTTFPCPGCAKLIAEAGVKEVLYETGYSLLDAQDTLKAYGVSLKRVTTSQRAQ